MPDPETHAKAVDIRANDPRVHAAGHPSSTIAEGQRTPAVRGSLIYLSNETERLHALVSKLEDALVEVLGQPEGIDEPDVDAKAAAAAAPLASEIQGQAQYIGVANRRLMRLMDRLEL